MTIADVLKAIHTGDYSTWNALTLREKWSLLKETEAADRLGEIATALGIMRSGKVTIGAELNRRADPEKAAIIDSYFR